MSKTTQTHSQTKLQLTEEFDFVNSPVFQRLQARVDALKSKFKDPEAIVNIQEAFITAYLCHDGQVRKYTGEAYIHHPVEVAEILLKHLGASCTWELIVAALLHDTVEDCYMSLNTIKASFGKTVSTHVVFMTAPGTWMNLNRDARHKLYHAYISFADSGTQSLKCADCIANTNSIFEHDKDFAKVYLREKRELLKYLTEADPVIYKVAYDICIDGIARLKG